MSGVPFQRKSGPMFVPRGATEPRQGYAFMHYCFVDGCDAWGSFGYVPKRGEPGTWACLDHKGFLTGYEQDASSEQPETPDANQPDGPSDLPE